METKSKDLAAERAEKIKAAQLAQASIQKQYGQGAISVGAAASNDVEAFSTGIWGLDNAIGVGGVPRGCITEVYGMEGLGKSLICIRTIASAQAAGELVALIDTEHAFNVPWAIRQGVDSESLTIAQPDSGEEGLNILRTLVSSGAYGLIVVDSLAALTPQIEIDGEIGDAQVAAHPRLLSQALRIINPMIGTTNTAVLFTNQLRAKIGYMANGGSTTTGGNAPRFYASVRIELKNKGPVKQGQEIIGMEIEALVRKNKVAAPMKKTVYNLIHGKGVDNYSWLAENAVRFGFLKRNKSFYYLVDSEGNQSEKSVANGSAQISAYLASDLEFTRELKLKVDNEFKTLAGYSTGEMDNEMGIDNDE